MIANFASTCNTWLFIGRILGEEIDFVDVVKDLGLQARILEVLGSLQLKFIGRKLTYRVGWVGI